MLAGARLGDHPLLAHAHRQQRLAHGVVDLVGTGMVQVLALQINPGATGICAVSRRAKLSGDGRPT